VLVRFTAARWTKASAMVVILGSAATACPQGEPPLMLLRAAQCLASKQFLPPAKSSRMSFGYFLDEKSYPAERVLYVVNFAAPDRLNGLVFTVVLTEQDGIEGFDIQNNASFILSKKNTSGVDFVNPPLGGTWTQQHIASAIQQIEKQTRFTIQAAALASADSSARCEAYTDPQPREIAK
jgi:hypothetical protein